MKADPVSVRSIDREVAFVTHEMIVQGSKAANLRHQELIDRKRHKTLIFEFFNSHKHQNVLTSSMLQYLVKVRGLYIEFKCKLGGRSTPDEIREAGGELDDLCGFYPKTPMWC
jgi:hypothetical protein